MIFRAVLLAQGDQIGTEAILLTDPPAIGNTGAAGAAAAQGVVSVGASAHSGLPDSLVGRTVADVERDLILETLTHCLGNRTHAANILGISIRTLRNKLKLYTEDGIKVPMPRETDRAAV